MLRALGLLALFTATLYAQGTFTEWTMPTPNSQPHCVAVDSKGRVWYAAIGADRIGYFDSATETFREVAISTQNAHPHGIAVSPGDIIWLTEQEGNKIGRIDPA